MNALSRLPERAMELASQVGEGFKDAVPASAVKWIETGAALGALKTGGHVATRVVRRNPLIAMAAVAGAGLLWYAARRRAKQAGDGAIEGSSKRIEAKREDGGTRKRSRTTRGSRTRAASTES